MLSDFTGADKVFMACGYTDLRRGIDGLASIVNSSFHLTRLLIHFFFFAVAAEIDLKRCIGRTMGLSFCIKG